MKKQQKKQMGCFFKQNGIFSTLIVFQSWHPIRPPLHATGYSKSPSTAWLTELDRKQPTVFEFDIETAVRV